MKKGFTLIELLAVIVILAIIALIATPIILNIISDTKEESNKRSVEMYGSAVKNAVAQYQLNKNESISGTFTTSNDGKTLTKGEIELKVEYNGNVKCTTTEIYEDGSIYLAGCIVGTDTKEYTYGIEHVTTIYRSGVETIKIGDTVDPTKYTKDATTLNKNYYFKHVLDSDNRVIESWTCAVFNGKGACIRGGTKENGSSYYTENELILKGLQSEGFSCSFASDNSYCYDSVTLTAYSNGSVTVSSGFLYCNVSTSGSSGCYSVPF